MEKRHQTAGIDRDSVRDILIIGSIGIGNLLLFSPSLKLIRNNFPDARITVIVLKEGFKALYEHDSSVDRVMALDVNRIKTFGQKAAFLRELRKTDYQLCITTFPANRLEYNVLAFLSGAKWRIAHTYESKQLKSLAFLQNIRVPVDKTAHDLQQNLNLVVPLGIQYDESYLRLFLETGEEARKNAEEYLQRNGLSGKTLVGIHPGSSAERGMDLKRWPAGKFAEICDWLISEYDAVPLIFGGPEELTLREEIRELAKTDPHLVSGVSLLTAAEIIAQCRCFFTNDSGLMHVAVSLDVPTVSLFGPTDPGRTSPFGDQHAVIRRSIDCSPCWSIHNLGVGNVNCIHDVNICMTQLDVAVVKDELTKRLKHV